METKPLLYGLIGFFLGGLIVSVAATTIDKPCTEMKNDMSINQMTNSLYDKQGNEFGKVVYTERKQGWVKWDYQTVDSTAH